MLWNKALLLPLNKNRGETSNSAGKSGKATLKKSTKLLLLCPANPYQLLHPVDFLQKQFCLHTLFRCLSWAMYHVFLKLFCNNPIRSPTIMPAMEEGRTSLAQTCLGDVADMNPHLPARTLSHNAPSILLFKTKINSYKAPRTVPCMH